MKTIETELLKYRTCRASLDRGCDMQCEDCRDNLPGSVMSLFSTIEALIKENVAP